ncbi:DUF2931 family protein [Chryseobacterium sp. G0162]|uniref:DUF2931 family protein n=2 Tax=Chryseobacterium TaxID=59732 RepID=A0AAD0YP71_CHRNA|nr:DUF2931 family protein [Chryseobacterium nakagawai]AZA92775.1 DUF2931 family protein [Chryseobacterium nakagawai]AZB08222.1 DUF2931 family protein [Chryseobacterium sp. G0162]VEH19382.1 Protein of uncharacterised function (DUF2931) [Chryseobacterium nakagawai]
MNKILKYLLSFLFFTQMSCQEKKAPKKTETMTKYEWTEGTSAPLGYPMEVYKGGIECEGGEWVSLGFGMIPGNGAWGSINHGMGNGFKSLPSRLDFVWISYMENQFYMIDTTIDIAKIKEYFSKGYETKVTNGSGETEHLNYDEIGVGMAPGGVVVVWIAGVGIQKEVGRYQAKKVTIPESEIAQLDSHQNRFWRKDYLDDVFNNGKVIPAEVKEKNKGKAIPFGLWDTYRIRYSWKPVFELPENAKLNSLVNVKVSTINGEKEQFDTAKNILAVNEQRAIPVRIMFDYIGADHKMYGAHCDLNENSGLEAFKAVFGDDPDSTKADIIVKVNEANSYFTIKLRGENGKEAFIKTDKVEVF